MMKNYFFIDTEEGLIELRKHLYNEQVKIVGMDLEADYSRHGYGEKLCLIQLYDGKEVYLIDALAVSEEEVCTTLTHKQFIKVFFDAGSDMALVYRLYGIVMYPVIDLHTIAGVLDTNVGGLNSVLSRYLAVQVSETKKKYQKSDWRTRPLPPDAAAYAAGDVRHLIDLYTILIKSIEDRGLVGELANAMERRRFQPDRQSRRSRNLENRLNALSHSQRLLFDRIKAIREGFAMIENRPKEHIICKELLFDIACGRRSVVGVKPPKSIRKDLREAFRSRLVEACEVQQNIRGNYEKVAG
ncbi:ribonuclease D [Marispirochaeta aestuarii]|nr:hypothetical protein [Marispirochaeta aestuarii]